METLKLRKKFIQQFDMMINNDENLAALAGVFDALVESDSTSEILDEHYDLIYENRERYLNNAIESKSWEEVKEKLKSKYGL